MFFLRAAMAVLSASSVFLLAPPQVSAAETETLAGKGFAVVYPAPLRPVAEKIHNMFPGVIRELEHSVGFEVDFHSTVVLVADRDEFRRLARSPMVTALAIPRRNLILIDRSRPSSRPDRLRCLLKHELCHLLLHKWIPHGNLPRWLDEGVAQWVSGGFSEVMLPRRRSVLDQAVLSGRTIPLYALCRGFSGDERTVLLSYEQSLSIVQFIVGRYGPEALRALLVELSEGTSIEDALLKTLSLNSEGLDTAWLDDLKDKAAWTGFFIGHLYEFIFLAGAVLLAVGFVRRLRKKRAAMDALDDAE